MTTHVSPEAPANGRTFDEQLGEAIHQQLWRRRIKQSDFAEQVLGITQSALSQKLRGKRPFFAGEVSVIAAELGVPVDDLMPDVEVEPPTNPPNVPLATQRDDNIVGGGAPTRTRTWDLRITIPTIGSRSSENQFDSLRKVA